MFVSTLVGNYPRPHWLREELIKREGKQKKVGHYDEEIQALYCKATKEIVTEFTGNGIELPTDGLLKWTDSLAYFCENLGGLDMTGLVRFFDNNFYYRQPEVTGELKYTGPQLVEDYKYASSLTSNNVKAILPGPYTLARLSKNSHYNDTRALMEAYNQALIQEAKALESAGCKIIQVDEPSLVFDEELMVEPSEIKNTLDALASSVKSETILATYFSGFTSELADLMDCKFTTLGFDLVDGKGNVDFLTEHETNKNIQLGLIDSRSIRLEKEEDVKNIALAVSEVTNPKTTYVSGNWGFELMPREYALRKLKLLSTIVCGLKEECG